MKQVCKNICKWLSLYIKTLISDAYLDLLLHVAGMIGAIVVGGQALHHLRGALGSQT